MIKFKTWNAKIQKKFFKYFPALNRGGKSLDATEKDFRYEDFVTFIKILNEFRNGGFNETNLNPPFVEKKNVNGNVYVKRKNIFNYVNAKIKKILNKINDLDSIEALINISEYFNVTPVLKLSILWLAISKVDGSNINELKEIFMIQKPIRNSKK